MPGCGDAGAGGAAASASDAREPTGTLRVAVAEGIDTLDPLLADGRAERLASRQIHEPLVATQNGPFGQTRRRRGLVQSFRSNAAETIWTARLRDGVRFQDGAPFDASAVKANAERWLTVEPGPTLLPELVNTDFPRPGIIRFFLTSPTSRFPHELADPRLGVVTPSALVRAGSRGIELGNTGTGPFELRERGAGRTLLARNARWWGGSLGLGPGVTQIELLQTPSPRLRVDGLIAGSAEVADQLTPAMVRRVEGDPLLSVVRGGGSFGVSRSVRGIDSAKADQSLSDVWLTTLR